MSSSKSTRTLVGLLVVVALAVGFWMLVFSPKRKEANELKTEVTQLQQNLVSAQARATEALAAKKAFPADYRRLVVLGKAVPEGDETASLLVSLSHISRHAGTSFENLLLESTETVGGESTAISQPAGPTEVPNPVPPTEAEAALLPLGASVGIANLGIMPYTLSFYGGFFEVTKFIQGVESQIKTGGKAQMIVNGRLLTIDGFSLVGVEEEGKGSTLKAEFKVTSYIVPPSQGITAGATATSPEAGVVPEASSESGVQTSPPAAAEAATGTPSSFETGEPR